MIVARHEVPGARRNSRLRLEADKGLMIDGRPGSTRLQPSLRDETSLHHYPGTSCLATITLSLRDKSSSD